MTFSVDRDGFWHGETAEDLLVFFRHFPNEDAAYPVSLSRRARCTCGSDRFGLTFFAENGIGALTCADCGARYPVADAEETWDDAAEEEEPIEMACPRCGCESANAALGLATYDGEPDAVRWLWLATRCTGCGLIGWPYETEIGMDGVAQRFLATVAPPPGPERQREQGERHG